MTYKLKMKRINQSIRNFGSKSILVASSVALTSMMPIFSLEVMAQNANQEQLIAQLPGTSLSQDKPLGSTTILPTDVVPLAGGEERTNFVENFQLRLMQRLPSKFYFSSSTELTGRMETNPFQFPTVRKLLSQLPQPPQWRLLNWTQQAQLYNILGFPGRTNIINRILPNVTGGWAFTPHTRAFCNYFMIRDALSHSTQLNTIIHSLGFGLQHDIPVTAKGNVQFEFQGRELWQLHQQSVFDFLPGITFSYILNPRTVLFANGLVQMRGKAPFQAPKKEIDPFYTWGVLHQRNGWTFSASTTFVQNFREPFRGNATIRKNNYVFISDFEISRRILKQMPGLQAFIRAEPIWNGHSHATPGLAGVDFRLFAGMRFSMAKQALTATIEQIHEQLQEAEPLPPPTKPSTKPSALITPAQLIALSPQPIHGYIGHGGIETCINPDGDLPLIAEQTESLDEQEKTINDVDGSKISLVSNLETQEVENIESDKAEEKSEKDITSDIASSIDSTENIISDKTSTEKVVSWNEDKQINENQNSVQEIAMIPVPTPLPTAVLKVSPKLDKMPKLENFANSTIQSKAIIPAAKIKQIPLAKEKIQTLPKDMKRNVALQQIVELPKPSQLNVSGDFIKPAITKPAKEQHCDLKNVAAPAQIAKSTNVQSMSVLSLKNNVEQTVIEPALKIASLKENNNHVLIAPLNIVTNKKLENEHLEAKTTLPKPVRVNNNLSQNNLNTSSTSQKSTSNFISEKQTLERVENSKIQIVEESADDKRNDEIIFSNLADELTLLSPNMALLAYDNLKPIVKDEPLIADRRYSYANSGSKESTINKDFYIYSNKKAIQKKTGSKNTEMKVIPPFPSIEKIGREKDYKTNSVDISIPILPTH